MQKEKKIVFTIRERCRVCYTCVRECPSKAIKINNGQAEVVAKRCIACGNCVKVCSQNAKSFRIETQRIEELIQAGHTCVALVAPSFPAEFDDIPASRLVGMIRQLGFHYVTEVSFGADLVALEYKKLISNPGNSPMISSDCPAIVTFIEYYHSALVPQLAPIVSPMVAMARVVKKKYGDDVRLIFVGPCLAKKDESAEIDAAITFRELRDIFREKNILAKKSADSAFDPPHSAKGALFPVNRGLLQTMEIEEDILDGNVIVAEGRIAFQEALKEFEGGFIEDQHLELLCCDGCVMGPGMSLPTTLHPTARRYTKRNLVSRYVSEKLKHLDRKQWKSDIETYSKIDLSRTFEADDRSMRRPQWEEIDEVLKRMGKFTSKDYLDCSSCGYESCIDHAMAILNGLAENEMCLPFTIEKLHNYIRELNISNEKLATVQEALKQSEKLASLGQLSAGIAHELNNPLGVITMYSNILSEELADRADIVSDMRLIVEQADRCKKIVGGLLNFARKNQVNFSEVDFNHLISTSINSVIIPDRISVDLTLPAEKTMAMADKDQMTQVFSNLIKNSVDAMPKGGRIGIGLEASANDIFIAVSDTGTGIEKENQAKLFTPFFTTKPIGKGTGLGLSIIYGIVKMHKGDIRVESNADPETGPTGTTFKIRLPRHRIE